MTTLVPDLLDVAAEATEQALIDTAQTAVSRCNWVVGRCAAEWTRRYARGRTDADFAGLVGLSTDQVYQRRRVWETFGDVQDEYPELRWSHFYLAVSWDDAPECLAWAAENAATVAEMRAWRRATRGDDLDEMGDLAGTDLADGFTRPDGSPLPQFAAAVRDLDDEGRGDRTSAPRGGSAAGEEGPPFQPNAAMSAHRETGSREPGDGEYAPFRQGAATPPPGASEDHPADRPADQIARRVTGTLERLAGVLTPQVVASFRTLPERDRERLVRAVRELTDRVAPLGV